MLEKVKSWSPLSLSFSALFLIFFVVFFFVTSRMQSLSFLMSEMYEHPLVVSNAVLRIEGNMHRIHRALRDITLAKNDDEIYETSKVIEKFKREVYKDFDIVTKRFLGDEKMYRDALEQFKEWAPIENEIINLMKHGKRDEAAKVTKTKCTHHVAKIEESLLSLSNFTGNKAESFQKDAIEIRSRTLKTMFIVILILLFVVAFFIILLVRAESKMHSSIDALEQSEKKFRTFFDNAPAYCYMVSPKGEILAINNLALTTLGYTKGELIGKPLLTTIYASSSIDKAKKLFNKWGETGKLRNEELNIITKSGEERTVLLSVDAIKDAVGSLVHSISVQKDITSLKKQEDILKTHGEQLETLVNKRTAALKKSQNSLAEAQRIAHLGNWDWDIVNNDLQWSDEIYKIFSLKVQQFGATYEAFLNCVHLDDRNFVKESVNKALEEDKPYSIDHRIILPDGSERIVHEEAEVFRDDAGKAVRMVGTVQDITEREQIKSELQKNYETLRVVNSVLDFSLRDISIEEIFRYTIERIVTLTSFSFESKGVIFIIEGSPERLVMKANFGLDEQIQNMCRELPIGKCFCGKAAQDNKIQFVDHLDGRHEIQYDGLLDHGIYCVPIVFSEKILGVITVYTRRGHLYNEKEEEFLTTIANTLAGIIVRRYTEREKLLLEDKLRQSQQMRMLGQLTSGVAHEVRNPLNSIIAITEALFKDIGDNPEFQPYLEHIRKQVDRLSNLMRDLLYFGKPGIRSDLQPISIGPAIFETVNSWKHASIYKNHKVRIIESPEINESYINVDMNKMQQVFYNLIDNACEHSPEDQDILVSMERGEDDNILVKIEDKGSGVSPGHLPHIFDPFFTTRKKGTGLGLSIVKNIIELHGGKITACNNEPPPGLTVDISLPLIKKK